MEQVSLLLLAGGTGSRFGHAIPKQFHLLNNKPVILHSLDVFSDLTCIKEIIVVCEPEYQYILDNYPVTFANPGSTRQESVLSGLEKASQDWVMIHDSARPFIYEEEILQLIQMTQHNHIATLACKIPQTIKQLECPFKPVSKAKNINRDVLASILTPQCVKRDLLQKGLELAQNKNLNLTDDCQISELLDIPLAFVFSTHIHLKITVLSDLQLAEAILSLWEKPAYF